MNKATIDQFFDSLSEDVLKEKWNKYDKYSKTKNKNMKTNTFVPCCTPITEESYAKMLPFLESTDIGFYEKQINISEESNSHLSNVDFYGTREFIGSDKDLPNCEKEVSNFQFLTNSGAELTLQDVYIELDNMNRKEVIEFINETYPDDMVNKIQIINVQQCRVMFEKDMWEYCWEWGKIQASIEEVKEYFGKKKDKLTLKNVQVDCSNLTEDQVKQMAYVYDDNGLEVIYSELHSEDSFSFLSYNTDMKDVWTREYDENLTTITYDKFMELFYEPKNGWYKSLISDALIYLDFDSKKWFGFAQGGHWRYGMEIREWYDPKDYILATQEGVEQRLEGEAKKRGFKEGVIIDNSNLSFSKIIETKRIKSNELFVNVMGEFCLGGWVVMKNGVWAKVVEDSSKKLSLEDIQVDCTNFAEEQIEKMKSIVIENGAKLFEKERWEVTPSKCFFLTNSYNDMDGFYLSFMDEDKTEVTYEKFLELFDTDNKKLHLNVKFKKGKLKASLENSELILKLGVFESMSELEYAVKERLINLPGYEVYSFV